MKKQGIQPSELREIQSGTTSSSSATGDMVQQIIAAIQQGFTGSVASILAKIDPASLPAGVTMGALAAGVGAAVGGGTSPVAEAGVGNAGEGGAARITPVAMPETVPESGGEKKEGGEFGKGLQWAASPGQFFSRIKDSAFEEKIGFVFPVLEFGESYAKRTEKLNGGEFVTPEEKAATNVEALAPLAGIAGAAIGTGLLGPGGGLVGSAVGQTIGEIGAARFSAYEHRAESVRMTGENYEHATGSSAEDVKAFTQALREGAAAVREVQQAFTTLTNAGPGVGPKTLAGVEQMSGALGELFNPALSRVTGAVTADPFLRGAIENFGATGGALDPRVLGNLGTYFASGGDWQSAMQANVLAAGSATQQVVNPQWAKDKAFVDREEGKTGTFWDSIKESWHDQWHPGEFGAKAANYQKAKDRLEREPHFTTEAVSKELTTAEKEQFIGWADWQQNITIAGTQASIYSTEIGTRRQTTSTSDAELGLLAKREEVALAGRMAADRAYIADQRTGVSAIDETLKNEKDPNSRQLDQRTRRGFLAHIDQAQFDITQSQAQENQERRFLFERNLHDQQSGFGLAATRADVEGKSAEDIRHITERQGRFLSGIVDDPHSPITPGERSDLRASILTSRYQADRAVDDERFERINVHGTADLAGVAKAQATGSDADVFNEGLRVVSDFSAKIKELNDEIQRGGLTVADRLQKEQALNTARAQQSAYETANIRARDSNLIGQASDQVTRETLGLGRQIRFEGSASVDFPSMGKTFQGLLFADQRDIDDKPKGSRERSAAETKLATDKQSLLDLQDRASLWNPGVNSRVADIEASGKLSRENSQFERSMMVPYSDGPNTDRFSRGLQLEADYGQEIKRVQGQLGDLDKWKDKQQAAGWSIWESSKESYAAQKNDLLGKIEGFKTEQAQIENQRFSSMMEAFPEYAAGLPLGGSGAAVIPSGAFAALFDGGANPTFGRWGLQPSRAAQILGPSAPSDHSAGHDGHTPMPHTAGQSAAPGAGQSSETLTVLQTIARILSNIERQGAGGIGRSSAPVNPTGSHVQQASQTLMPGKRGF